MARHFIAAMIAAAACWATSAAQSELPDTLAVFDSSENVTIDISDKGRRTVTVVRRTDTKETRQTYTICEVDSSESFIDSPRGWNIAKLLKQNRKQRKERKRSHVYTDGLVGVYAGGVIPTGSHFPITGGWEIGVKNLVAGVWSAGAGLPSVSLGAGFGWRVMTVGHGNILHGQNGILTPTPATEGTHDHHSSIEHFHFIVPLTVNLPIHKQFALSVAGELHLNTYSTASSSWTVTDGPGGKPHKEQWDYKGLHQRIATVDCTAAIGWREAMGVYVTWSPMRPWQKGYGPQYKTLSVGAIINF